MFRGDWTIRSYQQGIPNHLEIHKGGDVLWTKPQPVTRTAAASPRPKVVCAGGRWGDSADFIFQYLDEAVPTHLVVNASRVPLDCISFGKFRGRFVLSPNVDYNHVPVRIECEWNGRLRRIAADLQMGPLNGIAVETEEGWKIFKERADMDAEYLSARRILAHVPPHYNGDPVGIEDWAWMEGDHFCGRPRNTASTIGSALHAVGESLRLSAGPYNRPSGGQCLARSVIHAGVMDWVQQDGEQYQIQLRGTFELGPDHAIWVWYENQPRPELVAGADWVQIDDTCLIALGPGAKPVAFAISFQGAWLGARACEVGWEGFADLIGSSPDWRITARWLRWWRVPLLHENLKAAARERIAESRLATILSWASTEDLPDGVKYSEEHEDAWRSVARRFLWNWKPDTKESAEILKGFGLLTGDPNADSEQPWDGYEEVLAIHPLLLAQAARRGLAGLYPEEGFEDLRYSLEKLRNRILDLDRYAGGGDIDRALAEARTRAAEAMAVDEVFVMRSLLPDAVALVRGALDKHHNLRVAIANSQAVRKYLAAAVIEKMIHGEVE